MAGKSFIKCNSNFNTFRSRRRDSRTKVNIYEEEDSSLLSISHLNIADRYRYKYFIFRVFFEVSVTNGSWAENVFQGHFTRR